MTATKKYSAERLMTVVLAPVVSEKSTFVADKNRQYVFRRNWKKAYVRLAAGQEINFAATE
jgi:large subunit ribosomal protein L23